MKNLASKYKKLKRQISGNREQTSYEESFGMPLEEQYYITPINKWNRRILAQIEFAITLSKENPGEFDEIINNAIEFLLQKNF